MEEDEEDEDAEVDHKYKLTFNPEDALYGTPIDDPDCED